jgi:hypothetical protein
LDRPVAFDHLICDGINADSGYVLASREVWISLRAICFSSSIDISVLFIFFVFMSLPLNS